MSDRDINIRVKVRDDGSVTLTTIGDKGEKAFDRINDSSRKAKESVGLLNRNVLSLAAGFGGAQLALDAARAVLRSLRDEVMAGFNAVEDFNLSVASMTAFMTTFSAKGASGDLAGAFIEANTYAKELIPVLEIMDAQTIATGKDLKVVAETMMMYGTVLDVNNKRQVDGMLNIVNVLKMITAGQNQDIQLRQETNALLEGQIRMTDRLPKLLQAIDPELEKHLRQWKEEGTLIENVGGLLAGFGTSTDLIAATWTAIGSTMETIHTRVLRGGMQPVYQDILSMATATNRAFMDQHGNLTELAQTVQVGIRVAWVDTKNTVSAVYNLVAGFGPILGFVGDVVVSIADGWGMILVVVNALTERTRLWIEAMIEAGKVVTNVAAANWKAWSFDFSGARQAKLAAEQAFERSGALASQGMDLSAFMTDVDAGLAEYFQAKKKGQQNGGKAVAPVMAPPPAPALSADEQLKKNAEENKKILESMFNMDQWYGDQSDASEAWFDEEKKRIDELWRLREERAKQADEEFVLLGEAAQEAEKSLLDVTRAALPEQERAVHDVHQAYAALNEQVNQLAAAGDISKEVAASLHENLTVRMTEDLDTLADKGKKTFGEDMKDAVTGWAAGFSATLTDLLWESDATFGDIAKSFGKMLTQMLIQKRMIEPMLDSAGGSSGWINTGIAAASALWGFADGGSFTVGGAGGTDSQLVAFRASPDETVTVTTPGQQAAGGNNIVFNNSFQINMPAGANRDEAAGSERMAAEAGRMLQNQMRAFLQGEMRPGGILNQQGVY